ncbi:hypothetical protein C5167_045454 [Papaver somniferum]|uniref:GOLD domain-containing protein n=1 Tax=Papaver somniferum TaxID=3469 RepID=A0A4Y7LES0_PAPSO|nr:uncharacterized protein LOC113323443 [Papaver somniferum]RZC82665.1 hypothetical protein C5167_045454 [Papaver somniferum]
MASTEGLMPITRAFLAQYYDKYPLTPVSEDVARLTSKLRSMSDDLIKELPLTEAESVLAQEVESATPHKIDQNMWKNREHIEEILYLMEGSHWPKMLQQQSTPEEIEIGATLRELKVKLQSTLKTIEQFHTKNSDNVFNTVMTYMPQDFRGKLIRQQRERSERNKQAAIDALVNAGGSIHDRFALLWGQQMERRRQLAQLGSATGVYKTLVTYLVGVPQVLLDFVKTINDDDGPMEEQRQRYGPSLYTLTDMAISIRFYLLISWGRYETRKLQKDEFLVLKEAVHTYTSEMNRLAEFFGEVFANSPFFIKAEDAGIGENSDDYKETIIPVGKTHEVSLQVDSVNSYIGWDFSLIQSKVTMDIGFSVEYIGPSGEKIMILPYRRCGSDQGNFSTLMAGCYKLIWDNSYSTFFRKTLRFKVDAIPPVADPVEPEVVAEAEG